MSKEITTPGEGPHPMKSSADTLNTALALVVFMVLAPIAGAAFAIGLMGANAYAASRTFTPAFEAKVVYVDDGDTVAVRGPDGQKLKVRLANIDAPETSHGRCKPGQPFSQASTQALKKLVLGKTIAFKCSTLDHYERHVCDLHLQGQDTANVQIAAMGLAWANRANPSYLRDQRVAQVEEQARRARVGLWADPASSPPWEWRREVWGNACAPH